MLPYAPRPAGVLSGEFRITAGSRVGVSLSARVLERAFAVLLIAVAARRWWKS